MEYENFIENVFKEINLEKSEIDLQHSYLFMCGGIVKSVSDRGNHQSLRSYIVDYSSSDFKFHDRIVLAEKYKNYFEVYDDLLKFEEDIALFCSLIVVFLESPGSLVEFGMFCSSEKIRNNLLVVASIEDTQNEDSFIYLGPLKYLSKKNNESVVYYPKVSADKEYHDEYLGEICNYIESKFEVGLKYRKYDLKNKGNIFYLVYEIINLFFPIIESEIKCIVENVLINKELDSDFLERILFILKSFDFVVSKKYGNYTFYYPLNQEVNFVKFHSTQKGGYQPSTVKASKARYFDTNSNHELTKKRVAALKIWMESHG